MQNLKPIYQINPKDYTLIARFSSIKEARKLYKNLFNSLNHPGKAKAYGCFWIYEEDYLKWKEQN